MDIDVYEFKGNLKKFEDGDGRWVDLSTDKHVGMVTVGDPSIPEEINERLKEEYSEGDMILVVVQ